MTTLAGKISWITGAGTGIGLGAAQALAQAGATVVMSGRRGELLEREAGKILRAGGRAEVEPLDVGDQAAVQRVADAIVTRHGRIDILVNSAGLNVTNRYWRNQTPEGWRQVIGINLDGTWFATAAALRPMRAQRDGVVINISSWAGVHHAQMTGAGYNASKHAVTALTETINMEEGIHGIRACAICPAEVSTPILDSRPVPPTAEERARMLRPEDLGHIIRFIAELPAHACINQLIVSPTWNRIYLAGAEAAQR
jgi:NAD(P)-dependent dehydrogenase (short-subunit alcohol dehydrogenase family)